ncbi:hypothetical protein LTR95_011720 [Oleoguttula sp. CCFEE 5521]
MLIEKIVGEVKFSEKDKQQLEKNIEALGKPKPRQASAVYQKRPERKKRGEVELPVSERAVDWIESHSADNGKEPEALDQRERVEPRALLVPEDVVDPAESHTARQIKKPESPIQPERKELFEVPPPEEVVDPAESHSAEQIKKPEPPIQREERSTSPDVPLPVLRHRSASLTLPPPFTQQQPLAPANPCPILPGLQSQSSPERRARKQSLQHALTTAIKRAAMRQSQVSLLSGTTAHASADSDVLVSGSTQSPRSPVKFDWTPVRRRTSSVQERVQARAWMKPFCLNVNAVEFRPAVQREMPELPEWRRDAGPLLGFAGTPAAQYQIPTLHSPPTQSPQQEVVQEQTFIPNLEPQSTQTLDELREHHTALLASLHHYASAYLAVGRLYHSTPMAARSSPWILPALQQIAGEAFVASRDRQLPELVQIFGEISMRLTQISKTLVQAADEDLGKLEAKLKRCDALLGEAAIRLKLLQSAVGEICGVYERDRDAWWVESSDGPKERGVAEREWVNVLPEVCTSSEASTGASMED